MGLAKHKRLLLGVFLAFTPIAAICQSAEYTEIIEQRQALYREIGTAVKAIRDETRKSAPMNFVIKSSVKRIASGLREVQPMFPEGSGPEAGIETKALESIWKNKAEFESRYTKAIEQADKLVLVAKQKDMKKTRAQLKSLGRECKGCHDKFRFDE